MGPEGSIRTRFGFSADVRIDAPLDQTDELLIVLFLDLFGPVGRPGAIQAVLRGLKDDLLS